MRFIQTRPEPWPSFRKCCGPGRAGFPFSYFWAGPGRAWFQIIVQNLFGGSGRVWVCDGSVQGLPRDEKILQSFLEGGRNNYCGYGFGGCIRVGRLSEPGSARLARWLVGCSGSLAVWLPLARSLLRLLAASLAGSLAASFPGCLLARWLLWLDGDSLAALRAGSLAASFAGCVLAHWLLWLADCFACWLTGCCARWLVG